MISPAPTSPRTPRLTRVARLARALDLRTPLFSKEVTASGRRISTYITRAVYALLMLGLVSIAYTIATAGLEQHHAGAEWVQRVQSLAPTVSMTILWFQFVVLALLASVLTSPSFCDERRHGTLGALFTTPLTAFQMCLGKLAGHMVQILILIAIAAPLMLALRVFGGIEADVIFLGLGLAFSTALLASSASMFHSVFAKRPVAAASAAVLTLILCYGIPPLALWALQVKNIIAPRFDLFPILSPPVAMAALTAHASGQPIGTLFPLSAVTLGAIAYNFSLALLFFVGAVSLVRRALIRDAGERRTERKKPKRATLKTLPAEELASSPTAESADPAESPTTPDGVKRRKRRIQVAHAEGPVDLGDTPIRWRELRQPIVNASWTARLVATGAIVVALAWIHYVAHEGDDHGKVYMVVSIIGAVLTAFLAAVGTAGAISHERESRTLETLLCTPLSAWEILTGKFWGALKRQLLIPAVVFAHLAVGVLFKLTVEPIALLHILLVLMPPAAFLCATGTLCSVLFRKGTAAASANFIIAAIIWMGLPAGWGILAEGLERTAQWHNTFEHVMTGILCFNPAAMTATVIHADVRDSGWGVNSDYDLVGVTSISLFWFLALELFVAFLFCGGAYLVLRLAARVLALKTGRHIPFAPARTA